MRVKRLEELQAAIHAIEGVQGTESMLCPPSAGQSMAPSSVPPSPGLHEWFGLAEAQTQTQNPLWIPPVGILLRQAALCSGGGGVVWIGRCVWPYPRALGSAGLLRRSIFIEPSDDASRLWAIDVAARSPAAAAVVADGSGLNLAATRRLQLAAESGSAPVLCARPPQELDRLSAAAIRWLVRCTPSTDKTPRWTVELLRCKGVRPETEVLRWTMEWKGAQGDLAVHAELVDRSDPAPRLFAGVQRSA